MALGTEGEMESLNIVKRQLRTRIKGALKQLTREQISAQSKRASEKLLSLPEYQDARRISIYLSMPTNEIVTTQILERSFQDGKKVYVPYIYKRSTPLPGTPTSLMDMLELKSLEDFHALKPDNWGIPTIAEDSIPVRKNCFGGTGLTADRPDVKEDDSGLDLIVMPGMAFDLGLGRLGHGKGYYDYFLQRYAEHSKNGFVSKGMPFLAALSLDEQVLGQGEQVPMGPTDWRIDALIKGDGTMLRADQ